MAEPTLEEQIRQTLPTLPVPVQKFFAQGKLAEAVCLLMERYFLHVDQGAILEQAVTRALLGLQGPDELAEELYDKLPISKQTVVDIMNDVNQEIFVPLREQIRSGGEGAQQPVKPAAPQAPRVSAPMPPRPVNMPVSKYYAPPPQSPAYSHPDNKFTPSPLVSTIAPLPPKTVMPRSAEASGAGETLSLDTKNQTSVNLINPGNRPEIHHELPPPPPPQPPRAPVAPAPRAQVGAETPLQQALRTVLPPVNLPGAMPPSDIIPPTPKIPPPVSSSGVDPYREPVE